MLEVIYVYLFVAVGLDVLIVCFGMFLLFLGVEAWDALPFSIIIDTLLLKIYSDERVSFPPLFTIIMGYKVGMLILALITHDKVFIYLSGSILWFGFDVIKGDWGFSR